MQLCHSRPVRRAVFDEPNLLVAAGLVPVVSLAGRVGLRELTDRFLTVPTDKGANAGLKVMSLVAGMVAGADSIEDMAILRHGGMGRVFDACYAPSTLGSFLRAFRFGHVRQLDAVASRVVIGLGHQTPLLPGIDEYALADMDDSIIEVHGYDKQGAGFGYTKVRGLNSFIGTVSTSQAAPVIVAQRLRKGSCGSARGAARLVADTLATVHRLRSTNAAGPVLLRADSAFYGHKVVAAARRAGAAVSITVRQTKQIKAVISTITDDAWTPIKYPKAVFDQPSGRWISRADVAEIPFTAFTSHKKNAQVPGRLVVRRIPELNPKAVVGQPTLFDMWRFHAFFTTSTLDTVTADKTHRGHAIIEQVHADLKDSALAHLPSKSFAANSAWLVLAAIAFNLTRAAAALSGRRLAKATTGTIRRTLIVVPARIAASARTLTLHLPTAWPWHTSWTDLFTQACGPPGANA
jgi:hypothetical protein